MKNILSILLLFLMSGMGAEAQLIADSVTINAFDLPANVTVEAPTNAYVGDTITMPYSIVDSAGNPSIGIPVWTVSDTARGEIVEETDSLVRVIIKRPGRVTFRIELFRLTSIRIGHELLDESGNPVSGTFVFDRPLTLRVGQKARLCAVGFSNDVAILASNSRCAAQLIFFGIQLPQDRRAMRIESYASVFEGVM